MCEEVQKPSVQVPKAMVGTIFINTVAGLLFLIPLVFVLPDIPTLVKASAGQPRSIFPWTRKAYRMPFSASSCCQMEPQCCRQRSPQIGRRMYMYRDQAADVSDHDGRMVDREGRKVGLWLDLDR